MTKNSKTVRKRRSGRGPRARTRARTQPPAPHDEHPAVEASSVQPVPEPAVVEAQSPGTETVLSTPEPGFAARTLPPEPERPLPAARRAIFFDVENTSRPEHIARVIDHLAVDRMGRRTDFVAVGNWRVIGQETGRLLARHGAQLVHSAPSAGVRDWSDLRIAVAAGVWLAGARPGDIVEIVTNDRAFDAVGDVAASLGIAFRRLSYQGLAPAAGEIPARAPAADSRPRRHGRGRRRGWSDGAPRVHAAPAASRSPEPMVTGPSQAAGGDGDELARGPHTAPHDEIIAVVRDLMQRSPTRAVTIDTLANALKARGFSRPPGSPRLITRLRRIKEVGVGQSGVITLLGAEEAAARPAGPVAIEAPGGGAEPPPSRRRRSRRGRRRRRPRPEPAPVV